MRFTEVMIGQKRISPDRSQDRRQSVRRKEDQDTDISPSSTLGLAVYNKRVKAEDIKQAYIPQQSLRDMVLRGETRLADAFEEAIIILGTELRITYANPAARDMLGIDKPGQGLATVMRNPAVIEMVKTVLQGGKPDNVTFHVESPVNRHFRSFAAPITTTLESETKNRALLVLYDVTDIVRSNDLRSDFLANASHELKTPVASLLGYIETLRGHAKNDEKARNKFLSIMQEQAERMQRLIDDLLSLRRIELSEHVAPTEIINFHQTVQSVLEIVAPWANMMICYKPCLIWLIMPLKSARPAALSTSHWISLTNGCRARNLSQTARCQMPCGGA